VRGSLNLWLLLVAVVCALSFWFGRERPTDRTETVEQRTMAAAGEVMTPTEPVHLLVLNGTDQPGLAREFGLLLGQAGCVAEQVGNAPHDRFAGSFLVNRQLSAERAEQLAATLGGVPILREFDGRSAADAVLVLGRDAPRLKKHLQGT